MTRTKQWLSLLPIIALALPGALALGKDKPVKNQWRVWHKLTNQRHEKGTPLLLRVADHSIQALDGKTIVLDVPAAQVRAITFDDDLHRPVGEWLSSTAGGVSEDVIRQVIGEQVRGDWTGIKAFSGLMCAGSGATFCRYKDTNFMATLAGDVGMAAFATILDKHRQFRSIDLVWLENGVLRNVLFHVENPEEERKLLDTLASETGKPWVDLTEKRRQLHDQIQRYNNSAQPLVLDRTVFLDSQRLPAGEYRVVSVSRENDSQLNFFRGTSVTTESFIAQAIARRTTHEGVSVAQSYVPAKVRYTEERLPRIAEITTNDSTFLFAESEEIPPPPATFTASEAEPDLPVLTLTTKNGNIAQVTLVIYRRQRAFRFPVEHMHTQREECAGSLYVTADRIAFDAGLNLHKDRDPFDVARSETKEARIIPRSATSWGKIRIVVGKKKYDFMPYFSNSQSPLAQLPGTRDPVGWITGFGQLWNTGTIAQPMLDAFMDALSDFAGTIAEVETGQYNPKPHKKDHGNKERIPERDSFPITGNP